MKYEICVYILYLMENDRLLEQIIQIYKKVRHYFLVKMMLPFELDRCM